MATLAHYYEKFKEKKDSAVDASRAFSNFPHRLNTVSLTGSISFTVDERNFTANSSPSNGSIVFKFEASLNMALVSPWNRVFLTKIPSVVSVLGPLGLREFSFSHTPQFPWRSYFAVSYDTDFKNVGSVTVTEYTYSTASNSWSVTGTSSSTIECDLTIFIWDGGHSLSGGNDGTSACTISSNFSFIGDDSTYLDGIVNADFERLPWEGTWNPESVAFSNSFSQRLSDLNALYGGGFSGTCGMSMVFTNV